MTSTTSAMSAEMQALKQRLKATWMAGDYGHFRQVPRTWRAGLPGSPRGIQPGMRVLDVAMRHRQPDQHPRGPNAAKT